MRTLSAVTPHLPITHRLPVPLRTPDRRLQLHSRLKIPAPRESKPLDPLARPACSPRIRQTLRERPRFRALTLPQAKSLRIRQAMKDLPGTQHPRGPGPGPLTSRLLSSKPSRFSSAGFPCPCLMIRGYQSSHSNQPSNNSQPSRNNQPRGGEKPGPRHRSSSLNPRQSSLRPQPTLEAPESESWWRCVAGGIAKSAVPCSLACAMTATTLSGPGCSVASGTGPACTSDAFACVLAWRPRLQLGFSLGAHGVELPRCGEMAWQRAK